MRHAGGLLPTCGYVAWPGPERAAFEQPLLATGLNHAPQSNLHRCYVACEWFITIASRKAPILCPARRAPRRSPRPILPSPPRHGLPLSPRLSPPFPRLAALPPRPSLPRSLPAFFPLLSLPLTLRLQCCIAATAFSRTCCPAMHVLASPAQTVLETAVTLQSSCWVSQRCQNSSRSCGPITQLVTVLCEGCQTVP